MNLFLFKFLIFINSRYIGDTKSNYKCTKYSESQHLPSTKEKTEGRTM